MPSDLIKQQGIEEALRLQAIKNKQARSLEWGGDRSIKDRIEEAIAKGARSIVGYLIDYKEPNLEEIEEKILIEQAWGSEEFSMDLRLPPDSLGCFEIMLKYPGQRNPRGAGRKKTGHRLDVSLSGLSNKAFSRLKSEAQNGNRSAYIVALIEADQK